MFEGHDTTAAAASWACQLIGSHPDVQKLVFEEIERVLGRHSIQAYYPIMPNIILSYQFNFLILKEQIIELLQKIT